jgi:hypothetical protein
VARYEISIEVFDGAFSASTWQHAYGDLITSTAVEHGATEWQWVERPWGLVCEIAFRNERDFDRWRGLAGVRSAFDAVPDPVFGLFFHRGWGGTSGSGEPRRPRPLAGSGAAELEFEEERRVDDIDAVAPLKASPIENTRTAAAV